MGENKTSIVHLSDLHLTASDNNSRSELKLFGFLKGMNGYFRQIIDSRAVKEAAAVIITGDVTDRGDLDTWKVFWNLIDEAKLHSRVIVVPGNHDMCCLGWRWPSAKNWKTDMERMRTGLEMGGQPTKFPAVRSVNDDTVIFLLNSNNLGNTAVNKNAVGRIDYFNLVDFAGLLYKYRDVPVKIVALHHNPNIPEQDTALRRGQTPISEKSRSRHEIPQDQRRAFRLLCLTHRVRLVLHGHLHSEESRRVNGIAFIGAPASTEPIDKKSGKVCRFWQYDLSDTSKRVTRRVVEVPVEPWRRRYRGKGNGEKR